MDARAPEHQRPPSHGLVRREPGVAARLVVGALVAACLLAALVGGLLRLGVVIPGASSGWAGHAASAHGGLMIAAFFAAVIAVERAVAVKLRWAFAAPVLAALGGVATVAGLQRWGTALACLSAAVFVAVNAVVVRRQPVLHTWILLAGALALLAGDLLHAWGAAPASAVALWFAFLVVTIAAERLEMTRLLRRRPGAQGALLALLAGLLAGAFASGPLPGAGGWLYGAALLLLGGWLLVFDIAWRTVRTQALSRYMAVCLLAGYGWLVLAGAAWCATSAGLPWRDLALHALGIGFVFSMIFGHAPVILTAVARVKIAYTPIFYVPLALLHGSMLLRLAGAQDFVLRSWAGPSHVLALAAFAAALAFGARRWNRRHAPPPLREIKECSAPPA